jgi:indolepyruvate ferredoxin oxidoreductase, beta subunit
MNTMPQSLAIDQSRPLSIAVLAMGGQGGGVLVDWIVALAESQNWVAQSTSVPGVAQRTGATIYYVELIRPRAGAARPVLSLMPVPGDVDVVIGAELMEAGRAIQRGLVAPDKTTLIASSHRSFAIQEKFVPGDGIADAGKVYEAASAAAKRFVAFDMADIADNTGSAVSAVLFGAVAGSGVLPFAREAFEATIRAAGIGIEPSLRGFAAGFDRALAQAASATPLASPKPAAAGKLFPALAPVGDLAFDALVTDARETFPPPLYGIIAAGLRKVVDYQDVAYGRDYLDVVSGFLRLERGNDFALTHAAAKYIAVAMAYDDVLRVADLKTRGSRFDRVRAEVLAKPDQIVYTTEFMHPRMEEVAGTLPAGLGLWLEGKPAFFKALDRLVNRGRRVRTGTIRWFLPLYLLGGLRRFRRGTLRHKREVACRDTWLDLARNTAPKDYDLAVAVLEARRLVKGYSDTYARGTSKFDKVTSVVPRLAGRADAAQWLRRLCKAALADEDGKALDGALATVETFL